MSEDCGEGELSVEKPRGSDFASAQGLTLKVHYLPYTSISNGSWYM